MTPPHLFSPFTLKGVTLRNRIGVSPMCQYSSEDGRATDWHLVHLGARALGGAGLIIAEATAVTADGRISPQDAGLWNDTQIEPLARITRFLSEHGAVPGIQLSHAGRKASTQRPWEGNAQVPEAAGGWLPSGPSALAFRPDEECTPHKLNREELAEIVDAFRAATVRALAAGYRWLELHGAHGYLLHEFLSPLSNQRSDEYGGSFENRIRLGLEVTRAVRATWPDHLPLTWRISATDWTEGGWTPEESVELAKRLKAEGVDLVDCSSGGNVGLFKEDRLPWPMFLRRPEFDAERTRIDKQFAKVKGQCRTPGSPWHPTTKYSWPSRCVGRPNCPRRRSA